MCNSCKQSLNAGQNVKNRYHIYRFINFTIGFLLFIFSIKKLLNTKRADLDFRREVAQFFFLQVTKNINLKKKIDIKKHAISSYFFMVKSLNLNFRSKHNFMQLFCI